MSTSYYMPEPVSQGGAYRKNRSMFDGFTGFMDGLATAANGVGNVVTEVNDIRKDIAHTDYTLDDLRLLVEGREQEMALKSLKTDRGDNVQMYYVFGAVALGAIFLLR